MSRNDLRRVATYRTSLLGRKATGEEGPATKSNLGPIFALVEFQPHNHRSWPQSLSLVLGMWRMKWILLFVC